MRKKRILPPVFLKAGASGGLTYYRCGRTWFFTRLADERKELNVRETWELGRSGYFFLAEDLARQEEQAFLSGAARLLDVYGARILFLWLENPRDLCQAWRYRALLQDSEMGGDRSFHTGRTFELQRYALFLPGGSRLALLDEEGELGLATETGCALFHTPGSILRGTGAASLSLTGTDAGVLRVDFELPAEEETFSGMDVGIRYYAALEGEPHSVTAPFLRPKQETVLKGRFDFAQRPEAGIRLLFDPQKPLDLSCEMLTLQGKPAEAQALFSPASGKEPGLAFARGVRCLLNDKAAAAEYYLTFTGAFRLQLDSARKSRLACGILGTEYAGGTENSGIELVCFPGNAAFCSPGEAEVLDERATTAWISLAAPEGEEPLRYYSQPEKAALYTTAGEDSQMLRYMELPSAFLDGENPVPLLAYGRIAEEEIHEALLERMELECILPVRSARLLEPNRCYRCVANGNTLGTTPQGLFVSVSGDSWDWIGLANNRDAGEVDSRLTGISRRLQMEFQNSRLFLPMGDKPCMEREIGQWNLSLRIEGWEFCVDRERFRSGREDGSNTLLLFKYLKDRSIDEMMTDQAAFSCPELAGEARGIYRRSLEKCFDKDRNVLPVYEQFYRMATDRGFCGILILNCPLIMENMPDELKLLVMDLDEDALFAHHMGIYANEAEVKDGKLAMKKSSYFGLVDYQNSDVIVNEETAPGDFDFLITRILLEIRNSAIYTFSSTSELMLNRLFDVPSQKNGGTAGNCLILDGSYQKSGDEGHYVFVLRENSCFSLSGSMIEAVEITAVRMSAAGERETMIGTFSLDGKLRFADQERCDLFSYGMDAETGEDGYLTIQGLPIVMRCGETGRKDFTVDYVSMSFDLQQSCLRSRSLPRCLPARMTAFTRYEQGDTTPRAMGFRSITCPVSQGEIKTAWYGIFYEIPLGSLGQNGSASLELELLCAFGIPEEEGAPPVFVGVKLPGMSDSGIGMSLQGILKLDFKAVELLVYELPEKRDYQLCLRNFSLQALGLSFPPGKNHIYLFGDDGQKLGWYAAYEEGGGNGSGKSKSDNPVCGSGNEQSH